MSYNIDAIPQHELTSPRTQLINATTQELNKKPGMFARLYRKIHKDKKAFVVATLVNKYMETGQKNVYMQDENIKLRREVRQLREQNASLAKALSSAKRDKSAMREIMHENLSFHASYKT